MKWGYINRDGRMVVPAQWTLATDFEDGTAFVFDMNRMISGYIDRTGRFFNPSHPLELSADEVESDFSYEDDFDEEF